MKKKTLKDCPMHGHGPNGLGCYCGKNVGEIKKLKYFCEICHEEYSERMFTEDKCREMCNKCFATSGKEEEVMSKLKKPEKKELSGRYGDPSFQQQQDIGFNECWKLFNAWHEQELQELRKENEEYSRIVDEYASQIKEMENKYIALKDRVDEGK